MAAPLRSVVKEIAALPFWAAARALRVLDHRPLRRLARLGWLRARVGRVSACLQLDGPITLAGTRRIRFPAVARFGPHVHLETREAGSIRIGEEVRLNQGTFVVSYARIEIGDRALVGEYVTIRDANHGTRPGRPIRTQPHEARPVRIGADVWIGRGACLLPGVTVGAGAVVGANSVVTRDVPPGAIVAGAPARLIRMRSGDRAAAPR